MKPLDTVTTNESGDSRVHEKFERSQRNSGQL